MGFFRSESMDYYQLVIPDSNAHEILAALGRLNLVHFIDKNKAVPIIYRPYVNILKHCSEFEHRIEQIERTIEKFGHKIKRCSNMNQFLNKYQEYQTLEGKSSEPHFREIENKFDNMTHSLLKTLDSYDEIQDKLQKTQENLCLQNLIRTVLPENFAYTFLLFLEFIVITKILKNQIHEKYEFIS